jgi:hypothetical protein
MGLKLAGTYSSPLLLTYLRKTKTMNDAQIDNDDTPQEPPVETHPIDVVIKTFDDRVNTLRERRARLKDSTTTNAIDDCLSALVAMQGFMREVRKLFGDLI